MSSTPDLASDKEVFGHPPTPSGFDNQYPSDRFLTSEYTSRTREKYLEASGQRAAGFEPRQSRSCIPSDPKKRRWVFWGIPIAVILIAGIAVGVAVGVTQGNKSTTGGSTGSSSGNGGSTGGGTGGTGTGTGTGTGSGDTPAQDDPASNPFITTGSGESGSAVTTDLGVQFTYSNDFGGSWSQNPDDPYSVGSSNHSDVLVQYSRDSQVSGQAQSFTPRITEDWVWGRDHVRG